MTGARGPGLRRDTELGQGGSWDVAEPLRSGQDLSFVKQPLYARHRAKPFLHLLMGVSYSHLTDRGMELRAES